MAPTVDFTAFRGEDVSSTKRRQLGVYTGPSSYATGGDGFTPADVKLGQIDVLLFEVARNAAHTTFYNVLYNKSTQKVMWLDYTGAEIANATDLSGFTARFEAIGQ